MAVGERCEGKVPPSRHQEHQAKAKTKRCFTTKARRTPRNTKQSKLDIKKGQLMLPLFFIRLVTRRGILETGGGLHSARQLRSHSRLSPRTTAQPRSRLARCSGRSPFFTSLLTLLLACQVSGRPTAHPDRSCTSHGRDQPARWQSDGCWQPGHSRHNQQPPC